MLKEVDLLVGLSPALGLYRHTSRDEFTSRVAAAAAALKRCGGTTLVLDHSRKYGAGIGMSWLRDLGPALEPLGLKVVLHHKVGWRPRECLPGESADQFEPGVWHLSAQNITVDQQFDRESVLEEIFETHAVVELLETYGIQSELWAGAHDPDQLISAAAERGIEERQAALALLAIDTYPALFDMQQKGWITAVSIGAKNWEIALELVREVEAINHGCMVKVVMPSNCWTAVDQPEGLRRWLDRDGETRRFVNAGVFNGGALTSGSDWFNYRQLPPGHALLTQRDRFQELCRAHGVSFYNGATAVALSHRSWRGVALGLGGHIVENITDLYGTKAPITPAFFEDLHRAGLISAATLAELS